MSDKEFNPNTRLISGSEVKSFQTCEMQWWYNYRLGVTPKKLSDGLFRGIMGHEALSDFYGALKNGATVEQAHETMRNWMARESAKNNQLAKEGFITLTMMSERMSLITELAMLLDAYVANYGQADFDMYEVVEVEHMHVSDDFFAMRLDVLFRERLSGQLVLADHKFVANFYGDKQIKANSQLPLYMRVVVGDRLEIVSHGFLNEIRTRVTKEGPEFERVEIPYIEAVAKRRALEQGRVAARIREKWRMGLDESRESCDRNLSDYSCKFCLVAKPCFLDLEGKVSEMKAVVNAEYERSTYGYNK